MLEPADIPVRFYRAVNRVHRWIVIGAGVLFVLQFVQMVWPSSTIGQAIRAIWP